MLQPIPCPSNQRIVLVLLCSLHLIPQGFVVHDEAAMDQEHSQRIVSKKEGKAIKKKRGREEEETDRKGKGNPNYFDEEMRL